MKLKKNQSGKLATNFEEMEVVEELGDGWFAAGVATGVAIGVVVALT